MFIRVAKRKEILIILSLIFFCFFNTIYAESNSAINCLNCKTIEIFDSDISISSDRLLYKSNKTEKINLAGNKILIYTSDLTKPFYSKDKKDVYFNKKYYFNESAYLKYSKMTIKELIDLANKEDMNALFIYAIYLLDNAYKLSDKDNNTVDYLGDSIKLFKMGASHNHIDSAAMAGSIAKDYEANDAAIKYLSFASEKNNPMAAYKLAMMYINGQGVEKDEKKAKKLFFESASQGFHHAQYDYGLMLINGEGGDKNIKEGYNYILASAQNGNEDAIKYMKGCGRRTGIRVFCSKPPCSNSVEINNLTFTGNGTVIAFGTAGLSITEATELNLLISDGDEQLFKELEEREEKSVNYGGVRLKSSRFDLVSCSE